MVESASRLRDLPNPIGEFWDENPSFECWSPSGLSAGLHRAVAVSKSLRARPEVDVSCEGALRPGHPRRGGRRLDRAGELVPGVAIGSSLDQVWLAPDPRGAAPPSLLMCESGVRDFVPQIRLVTRHRRAWCAWAAVAPRAGCAVLCTVEFVAACRVLVLVGRIIMAARRGFGLRSKEPLAAVALRSGRDRPEA